MAGACRRLLPVETRAIHFMAEGLWFVQPRCNDDFQGVSGVMTPDFLGGGLARCKGGSCIGWFLLTRGLRVPNTGSSSLFCF